MRLGAFGTETGAYDTLTATDGRQSAPKLGLYVPHLRLLAVSQGSNTKT